MKVARLYNYEIVKRTMEVYKDTYLRKAEIAALCRLEIEQVSRIIKAAWKLGWVTRIETKVNNDNAFGEGEFSAIRTAYKIKRTDTWSGLMPLYKEVLSRDRKEGTE